MYKIPANTLLLGKTVVFVPECHSTNDYALELAQQSSTSEGTVVITSNQTAGRGQRGNTWEASPDLNLTFSLIIKPKLLSIIDQFYLNIFSALAVKDYLKEKSSALVQIKWPNDILIQGNKICGILIENQIQGSRFSNSIVGIGFNVNQQQFGISTATSLSLVTGISYSLPDELNGLLEKLDVRYLQLHQQKYSVLMQDYLAALYRLNERHRFSSDTGEFEGMIVGLDEIGRLKIETDDGIRIFGMKEVAYIR